MSPAERAWGGGVDPTPPVPEVTLSLREAAALLASLCADRNDADAWVRARAFLAAYAWAAVE